MNSLRTEYRPWLLRGHASVANRAPPLVVRPVLASNTKQWYGCQGVVVAKGGWLPRVVGCQGGLVAKGVWLPRDGIDTCLRGQFGLQRLDACRLFRHRRGQLFGLCLVPLICKNGCPSQCCVTSSVSDQSSWSLAFAVLRHGLWWLCDVISAVAEFMVIGFRSVAAWFMLRLVRSVLLTPARHGIRSHICMLESNKWHACDTVPIPV